MNSTSIRNALLRAVEVSSIVEDELNEADRNLGDGDTGTMLARLLKGIVEVVPNDEDLSQYLRDVADRAAETTGSSLGNLIAAGIRAAARGAAGKADLTAESVSVLVFKMSDAMMRVGGAEIGDKTIVDSLNRIAQDLEDINDWADVSRISVESASGALRDFAGKPCRIGRARMFADASRSHDDPGMRAVLLVLRCMRGENLKEGV